MMIKKSKEEKVSFIDLMIRLMKEKGIKGYELLEKTDDVDKCYDKALRYNRINQFVNLKDMESEIKKVVMESNEDFVKGIEAADEKVVGLVKGGGVNGSEVDHEEVVEMTIVGDIIPKLSNKKILMEALNIGIKVFDLGFLNMLGTDNVKVGFKDDKTAVYYVREFGKFINVNV